MLAIIYLAAAPSSKRYTALSFSPARPLSLVAARPDRNRQGGGFRTSNPSRSPMKLIRLLGVLVVLVTFAATAFLTWRYASRNEDVLRTRPATANKWDLVWLAGFLLFATWLMFATLDFKGGQFQIAFKAWTDFGANVSLTQSFALGHNFPPQHPFFPGEFIRYHFLFWFQAGNLEFLGLNPVWSINILSILSK